MQLKTLENTDVRGKRVLLRVALDVPLKKDGRGYAVASDYRIKAIIPTIKYLIEQDCRVGLVTWLGRPKNRRDPMYQLTPVHERLEKLLRKKIMRVDTCIGPRVDRAMNVARSGDLVLLENTRFYPQEIQAKEKFAKTLLKPFDVVVYDAFAQSHRIHASTTKLLKFAKVKCAGLLMQKEIDILSHLVKDIKHPFVVILGGVKVSTRLNVIKSLSKKSDAILIGGALANPFLAAEGHDIGNSLVESDFVDGAKRKKMNVLSVATSLLNKKTLLGKKLVLPDDMVARKGKQTVTINLEVEDMLSGWQFVDIGPKTIAAYVKKIRKAKTIFINGPLGVTEEKPFDKGTREVINAIGGVKGLTVAGGGDTEGFIVQKRLGRHFDHVSTGGGAALEFLASGTLPVLTYLKK